MGKPVIVRVARVLFPVGLLLVLAGCPNMISIDQLAAAVSGDIANHLPKLKLAQGATQIANGSTAPDFGTVVADGMTGAFAGSAITFTLTNGGGTDSGLTVSSVTVSGTNAADFVVSGPAPTTLAYNASTSFTVTYDPRAVGSSTASVNVVSTDPNAPTYSFTAVGTGAPFSIPSATIVAVTSFVMGDMADGITPSNQTVASIAQFDMGIYEVTYAQWAGVRTWALAHGYSFDNVGDQGNAGSVNSTQQPVTKVSWRDAIAWCNAASEMLGLSPVYYTTFPRTAVYRSTTASVDMNDASGTKNTNSYTDFT